MLNYGLTLLQGVVETPALDNDTERVLMWGIVALFVPAIIFLVFWVKNLQNRLDEARKADREEAEVDKQSAEARTKEVTAALTTAGLALDRNTVAMSGMQGSSQQLVQVAGTFPDLIRRVEDALRRDGR